MFPILDRLTWQKGRLLQQLYNEIYTFAKRNGCDGHYEGRTRDLGVISTTL
jgi:hypothetical protein